MIGWIIFAFVCVALILRGAWSLWKGAKKVRAVEMKVHEEMSQIEHLDLPEAEARARQFLNRYASFQNWTAPLPPEIEAILRRIDSGVEKLLRDYRRITFQQTGTEIGSEFLVSAGTRDGILMIGRNQYEDDCQLGVKADSPVIYEVSSGRVRESYPSIVHYFLLVEDTG